MKCELCHLEHAITLYQDEDVLAVLKDMALTPGQVTVFPRQHFTIMEMVPDEVLAKCMVLANKVSAAVFEGQEAQGTNILIQNGLGAGQKVPHFSIEVVPRREGDGLNLQWTPKQLAEDELESVFLSLKDEGKKPAEPPQEKKAISEDSAKKNYLIKSVRRIP